MLDLLLYHSLKELIEVHDGPCVSIYLPTHRTGVSTRQASIRLKNLLGDSEKQLVELGLRSPAAREMLALPQNLVNDGLFWEHQSDGLAIFIAPGIFRRYRLPIRFDELLVVTDRFHVKPLLPLFVGDGRFYVLAISQNMVKLLQGSRYSASQVDLEGVPESLADALRFDDPESQLQFYTRATQGVAGPGHAAGFHGHGAGKDDQKDNILRYFRMVDAGMNELLEGDRSPLVLACVEYLIPIYRKANNYPHLMEEGVTGNPEELNVQDLHRSAWEVVEPHFRQDQLEALERFSSLRGSGQVSEQMGEIVKAAYHRRVDTLFVELGKQLWGRFYPEKDAVHVHPQKQAGDEDLYDLAAVHTLINGGVVYSAEQGENPGSEAIAAIFRYQV